jgi:hypothetical protein
VQQLRSLRVDGDGESRFVHAIALERDLPYSEPPALPRSPRDSWIELLLRRRRGDDLARAEQLALELIDLPPKPVFAMAASAQIMEASGNANAAVAHWAAVRDGVERCRRRHRAGAASTCAQRTSPMSNVK